MKNLLLILLVLFSTSSSFARAEKTIKMAAGLLVEPYIIESNNSGFEADIVTLRLKAKQTACAKDRPGVSWATSQ